MFISLKKAITAAVIMFSFFVIPSVCGASDVIVRNNSGLICKVLESGNIENVNGDKIGFFDREGRVFDVKGNVLGRIDKAGNVYANNNNLAGTFEYGTGIVQDHRGVLVGLLDSRGRIINLSGKEVGSFSAGSKEEITKTIAALFFFDDSMLPCSAVNPRIFIYDKMGNSKGSISQDGTIIDTDNNKKGYLDKNGFVKDSLNNNAGTLHADGTVKSAQGQVIEHFSPHDPNFIAKAVYTLLFENRTKTSASL